MTHVYDGPPDARQSTDEQFPTSRFRPTYRALAEDEKHLHDMIKIRAEALEQAFAKVATMRSLHERPPEGRYAALALTALEEAVMWAIKGLTA